MVEAVMVEEEEVNMKINANIKAIFNADIAKNLATKKLTVGPSKGMNRSMSILPRKLKRKVSNSWLILLLINLVMVCGLWIVDALIIWLERSRCLIRSLKSHKKVKFDLEITSKCKSLAKGLLL